MTKYAYSLKTTRVKEPDFPYDGRAITCTAELVDFAKSLYDSDVEKMMVIFLDAQNKVTGIYTSIGTINQATVWPREIIKHALLCGACAMILSHNHPSGMVRPSDQDIRITDVIREIAKHLTIHVHDHIIVGENRWFSFREEGLIHSS